MCEPAGANERRGQWTGHGHGLGLCFLCAQAYEHYRLAPDLRCMAALGGAAGERCVCSAPSAASRLGARQQPGKRREARCRNLSWVLPRRGLGLSRRTAPTHATPWPSRSLTVHVLPHSPNTLPRCPVRSCQLLPYLDVLILFYLNDKQILISSELDSAVASKLSPLQLQSRLPCRPVRSRPPPPCLDALILYHPDDKQMFITNGGLDSAMTNIVGIRTFFILSASNSTFRCEAWRLGS